MITSAYWCLMLLITIKTVDAEGLNPVFGQKTYSGSISKDSPAGTKVDVLPAVRATAPDSSGATMQYKILDPTEMFTIDQNTALISANQTLSVDPSLLAVGIVATQVGQPGRESFTVVVINVTTPLNAPTFSPSVHEVTRAETEPVGSILLVTTATDSDFETQLEYGILEENSGFTIDNKGRIFIDQHLDYEQEKEKTVHVTASDGRKTATATVKISVTDVNDNNPVLHMDTLQFHADRQAGYIITTLSATDNDTDDVLRFELRTHSHLFAVNEAGELSITSEPRNLVEEAYPILIAVLDNGYPADRETSQVIEVNFPPYNASAYPPTKATPNGETTKEDTLKLLNRIALVELCVIGVLIACMLGMGLRLVVRQ